MDNQEHPFRPVEESLQARERREDAADRDAEDYKPDDPPDYEARTHGNTRRI